MCLDTITKTGLNKNGYGWKVFNIRNGKLYGDCFLTKKPKRLNRWLEAKRVKIKFPSVKYSSGFHIFTKRNDAFLWQHGMPGFFSEIRRVKYRKGHTIGTQISNYFIGGDIIVADEMLICPSKKKH